MKDSIEAAEYVAKKYGWLRVDCSDNGSEIASRESIHQKVIQTLEKYI